MSMNYGILVKIQEKFTLLMVGSLEECLEFEMDNHQDYSWMRVIDVTLI